MTLGLRATRRGGRSALRGLRLVLPELRSHTFGAVAQLGEQLLCKHQVVGSIPSSSTKGAALGFTLEAEQPLGILAYPETQVLLPELVKWIVWESKSSTSFRGNVAGLAARAGRFGYVRQA